MKIMRRPAASRGAKPKKAAKGSKVVKKGFLQSLDEAELDDNKPDDVVMKRPAGAAYSSAEMQAEIRSKKRALDIAINRHDDGIELLPDHVVEAVKSASKQRVGNQKALRDVVLEGIGKSEDGKYKIVARCPIFEDCNMICYGVLFCSVGYIESTPALIWF